MNTGERSHAAKPEAEKAVCPTLVLKNLECKEGVVVNGVDHQLHEVNTVALDLDILVAKDAHSNVDEALNAAVNLSLQTEHHSLGELAGTYPLNSTLDAIREHISYHRIKSLGVLRLLGKLRSTKLDKVIQSRQHIFQVVLSTSLERSVNQLEGLPHSGRDGLGGKRAAIDDLKDLVIKIIKLVLQCYLDDWHKNSLDVKQDIGGALKGKNQSTNGLQNSESSDALVVVLVIGFAIVTDLALLLKELSDDSHICVSQLLAQSYCEGRKLGGEDLNEILHNVGKRVDIGLVGELEQLLHDRGDVLLHACSNNIMTDERLKSKGCCDTNGKCRVGHTVENVSVYSKEVVGVVEIKLLKLLDSVASTSSEVALGAGEVREDITNKEVFYLVRDRALFAQNNRGQGSDHAQSTLLGNMVLVLIGSLLVLGNNSINKRKNLEGLLAAVFGEVDEEVRGSDVRGRRFLEVVELSVKVLVGLVLELFNVLLGEAEDREDKMSNEVGEMGLEVRPHLLRSYRLVEEDQSVRKARSAKPRGFGDPFLDLLEVVLEDLGGDVRSEVLGESKCIFALTGTRRVTVSRNKC